MIKFKEIKAMHTQLWCSKSCYLDPWISFITETPGSQPTGEMWDLDLLFVTSVRDNFLPRPARQAIAGPWMSSSWGLSFCALNMALLSSTGHLAGRSTGCAHARSWSCWNISPLVRPSQPVSQFSCLRLRKYRLQKPSLSDTFAGPVTTSLSL